MMNDHEQEQLTKPLIKLMSRIERIMVPVNAVVHSNVGKHIGDLQKRIRNGYYYETSNHMFKPSVSKKSDKSTTALKRIKWAALEKDIFTAISEGDPQFEGPKTIQVEIDTEKNFQLQEEAKMLVKAKLNSLQERNGLPVISGAWRKRPYAARSYKPLTEYVVTDSISEVEGNTLKDQLNTSLNGYLGQAYNYDDHNLTEEWMCSFKDGVSSAPSDDDVIRTQLESLMDILTVAVQDRVCTECGVLDNKPVGLGSRLKEIPVWGIDCYTRRMIELAIEDRVSPKSLVTPKAIVEFIEYKVLPSINEQTVDRAHNMQFTIESILQNSKHDSVSHRYASAVLEAIKEFGLELFRIHPKGTGVICIDPNGLEPHVVISDYLGEIYPPYRWCERMDVIEAAQSEFELKPTLPDFYNILLERPRQDPAGYGLIFVDASQKANMGSSCSHSCNSNCTSSVVARNGKLVIVLSTNRHVRYGEELTMDYYSITTSDVEWRAAVCLCGMSSCRGSFLHYATQDDLQQVLNQNCGSLWRYASLLRACSEKPPTAADKHTLSQHGMLSAALGATPQAWIQKYVADNLRFVEYERKALPCALMRPRGKEPSLYTYGAADMDARSVMEQRLQSMVCCFSMVQRVLNHPANALKKDTLPVKIYSSKEAADFVCQMLSTVPQLIEQHLLFPDKKASIQQKTKKKKRLSADTLHRKDSSAEAVDDSSIKSDDLNDTPMGEKEIARVMSTVSKLKDELELASSNPTKGLGWMRSTCLKFREFLREIENLSTKSCRLSLLADVLALWAYTTNFSSAQSYSAVVSDPIVVPARELGTSVPRLKIFKPEVMSKRKKEAEMKKQGLLLTVETDHESSVAVECKSSGECVEETFVCDDAMEAVEEEAAPLQIDVDENVGDTMEVSEDNKPTSRSEAKSPRDKGVFLDPNEPVFSGSKTYSEDFTFWQLMAWFNAGTDQKVTSPDVFGCIELPLPSQCFGECKQNYDDSQRKLLLAILNDERAQIKSWPDSLRGCFSTIGNEHKLCSGNTTGPAPMPAIFGSPMLDTALGLVDATAKAHREIASKYGAAEISKMSKSGIAFNSSGHSVSNVNSDFESGQYDSILPPELPTAWVQCEQCRKWRRLAWNIDVESLPDTWECSMNDWDIESASCSVPQDAYDPNRESTLEQTVQTDYDEVDKLTVGAWRDVYCTKNLVYYEGVVKKTKVAKTGEHLALFHFKGWNASFDEWIPFGSDRLYAHNFYTNSAARKPQEQELWQGLSLDNKKASASASNGTSKSSKKPVAKRRKTVAKSSADSKKRKSTGGDAQEPSRVSSAISQSKRRKSSNDALSSLSSFEDPISVASVEMFTNASPSDE